MFFYSRINSTVYNSVYTTVSRVLYSTVFMIVYSTLYSIVFSKNLLEEARKVFLRNWAISASHFSVCEECSVKDIYSTLCITLYNIVYSTVYNVVFRRV